MMQFFNLLLLLLLSSVDFRLRFKRVSCNVLVYGWIHTVWLLVWVLLGYVLGYGLFLNSRQFEPHCQLGLGLIFRVTRSNLPILTQPFT